MRPVVGRHGAAADHARLTHHRVRAASLEVRAVTKREGSAVCLVRSDECRASRDVYEALRELIHAARIKPGAYLSQSRDRLRTRCQRCIRARGPSPTP